MEVLISIVGSVCGSLADPMTRQLSYLFKHESKFQNLRSKVQSLTSAGERVHQSVHQANRNGEEIFPDVERLLTVVNEKISDQAVTQLQEDQEKSKWWCFAGFCQDFRSQCHLNKKSDMEADAIVQLLIEKDQFDRVSYRPSIQAIGINRHVKGYEAFESRSSVFNGIMVALEDDIVKKFGVYRMGGVGETTLCQRGCSTSQGETDLQVVFVAVTQHQTC
ncbi:hypothetical protein V6N11_047923 [Hibiscus sabdariffa]|uniref:Uncharacterized protein n=2 Tax=Hibiscus sabdariffa TaxID=183260 RepID=A0ABR2ANT5_9ROSI